MHKTNCPICGKVLLDQSWRDETLIAEIDKKCLICGYHNSWSYGYTGIEFGKYSFQYSDRTTWKEYEKIEKVINKARWKFRKSLLRKRVIKGRKYAEYF